jgi:hypothetical protein
MGHLDFTDENRKLVWEDLKQEMKQLTEKKQNILFPCNSISSLSQIEELSFLKIKQQI